MSQKIKLIWDFKGLEAMETAKHHCRHLEEFAKANNLAFCEVGFSKQNPLSSIAFIIVNRTDMKVYRDALLPHRGELS